MKYLKKFNENSETIKVENVKNFCEQYLSYLYDEDFDISVYDDTDYEVIDIRLFKKEKVYYNGDYTFKLKDIIDYFIPFITMLSQKYVAVSNSEITFHTYSSSDFNINVNDIINGNISDYEYNKTLISISIRFWRYSDINESIDYDKSSELKEYCENYLAYIMEYFTLNVNKKNVALFGEGNKYVINLYKKRGNFSWCRIKDYFIPFFNMLINDYDVVDRIRICDWTDDVLDVNISDIIEDNVENVNSARDKKLFDIDIDMIDNIIFCVR